MGFGTWDLIKVGPDGKITTDAGNLILNPEDGGANVGIGTLTPIDKLEVEGGFSIDGAGELGVFRIRQNDTLRWTFLTAPWLNGDDLRLRNEDTGVDGNGREIVEVGAHRKGIVEELEKAHIYIDQVIAQDIANNSNLEYF